MSQYAIEISSELLLAVKTKKDTGQYLEELEALSLDELSIWLSSDKQRMAFWINVYNAFYQILRERNYNKPEIYRKKLFVIAGQNFSLDDVEHGVLRRYRYKYSLGYVANLFVSRVVKSLAVDKVDYRIHFALNCGAKSCPPIAFYKEESIDEQLDLATQSFLESETDYDEEKKIVLTTILFQWFRADFGGPKGIKKIYLDQLGKDISAYSIQYKKYSWEDNLGNFVWIAFQLL